MISSPMSIVLPEIAEEEAREWNTDAVLPDIWEVAHHCERAGLDSYATETVVNWYVFLEQHTAVTLEKFLLEFDEGVRQKDYYNFSKYCLQHYREVHKKQLRGDLSPWRRDFIETQMRGAKDMDQLGGEYYADEQNNFWKENTSIAAPEPRELPSAYVRLLIDHQSFEKFLAAHKKFDKVNEQPVARITKHKKATAREVYHNLNQ